MNGATAAPPYATGHWSGKGKTPQIGKCNISEIFSIVDQYQLHKSHLLYLQFLFTLKSMTVWIRPKPSSLGFCELCSAGPGMHFWKNRFIQNWMDSGQTDYFHLKPFVMHKLLKILLFFHFTRIYTVSSQWCTEVPYKMMLFQCHTQYTHRPPKKRLNASDW